MRNKGCSRRSYFQLHLITNHRPQPLPDVVEQKKGTEMPQIVTAGELRSILGVSVSLYSDAYLEQMIDSAELTILPLLTGYQSAVTEIFVENSIAYYGTQRVNYFVPGQDVVITGCGVYDATVTVTDDRIAPMVFTSATGQADSTYTIPIIPSGLACIDGATAGDLYSGVAPIKSAILVVAVEVFQSVTAPGNQIMSDQFQPSPFVLGRSLTNRIVGLLGPFLEVETLCL